MAFGSLPVFDPWLMVIQIIGKINIKAAKKHGRKP